MAIISAATILTSISMYHLTIAYFFLVSPQSIADQTLVFILGEAMNLPDTRAFDTQSSPLSFLAAVLITVAISDLVSISMPEEISSYHWGTQAPIRLALFFILTFYSFTFSSSPKASSLTSSTAYQKYTPSSWGEGLKNRVVFTWAFLELITWFWAFVTLREERRELAQRLQAKRRAEEEDS